MIPIVTGFPRTFTSGMMGCLVTGGVLPYYSRARERVMADNQPDDWVRNKHGFWEVGSARYMMLGFSRAIPDGYCCKIQERGMLNLAGERDYRVIVMKRNPIDIRASYEKAFPDDDFDEIYPNWPEHYWIAMREVTSILRMRRDIQFVELWMEDVIDNPVHELNKVKALGINIDVEKAATAVDKTQYRFRGKENGMETISTFG